VSPIFFTRTELLHAMARPTDHAGMTASARRNDFARLAALGARQHGVAARWQASALGFDDWWLDHAVRRSHLHQVTDGIYAIGHPGLGRLGRATAALLRGGEGTVLSHISAARTWGIVESSTKGEIHISLASRRGLTSTDGISVHRPRALPTSDTTTHRGFPVTTPERTVRDLLHVSTVSEVTRMLEQMVTVLGRDPDELHAWGSALPHVSGRRKLERALDDVVGPAVLRSELERTFRSLCQDAGLPMPETNVRLGPWEVDALYRDQCVALELDSWRFHGGRWQFHRDRRKGLALNRLGYEVIRLTWPQVKHESKEVADTLRAVLARAGA
jgi:hypothetical protein